MPQIRHNIAPLNKKLDQLEALSQPVVAYGRELAAGEILPLHRHRRAQFVYAGRGVMSVTTASAAFVVPPQRAVWMPAGVGHRIEARSVVAMRTLYIEPLVSTELPANVCVLQVTPLLRELIIAAVAAGPVYAPDGAQSRIVSVILDQIATLPTASLALPMPTDARLLRVTQALVAEPGDTRSLARWAAQAGASERTLGRLFKQQTGMSFGAWRQQRRLLQAMELLATGSSVTAVALELGYDNTSAFIAMFRRCLGTTPARYFKAPRHSS